MRRIVTFALVSFAWIFFRANSIGEAGLLLERLFTASGWQTPLRDTLSSMGLGALEILMTLASLTVLLLIDRMLTYSDAEDSSDVLTKNGAFVYFVWVIFIVWALLLSKDMISTFIYFPPPANLSPSNRNTTVEPLKREAAIASEAMTEVKK